MTNREKVVELVRENGYIDLCEVGVWEGQQAKMLAPFARTLILVDPWLCTWNRFPEYVCTMGGPEKTQIELDEMYKTVKKEIPKATILRLPSSQAAKLVRDSSLDFVYIDAVHLTRYCLEDIRAWLPKIRKGGMLAGDDYCPETRGAVADAVDKVFGKKNRDTIWWEKV